MTPSPEVSVVMAVYNGAAEIRETAESVLSQTDCDLELVIVDDGSKDASAEVLRELASSDRRVRLFTQENKGLTMALRRGCDEARAGLVARQDCGDLSLPGRFRVQCDAMQADERLAFVSCWSQFRGPRLEYLYTVRGSGRAGPGAMVLDPAHERGLTDWPSCHPSVMFRVDAYRAAGGYQPAFYYGQDWDLWYRLAAVGWFGVVPRPLYVVRVDEHGISARSVRAQRQVAQLSLAAMRLRAAGDSDEAILAEAAAIRPGGGGPASTEPGAGAYFIGSCLFKNRDAAARDYLRRAVQIQPGHWRARLKWVVAEVAGSLGIFR